MIQIEHLADYPKTAPLLAEWLYAEWGQHSPDGDVSGMLQKVRGRMHRARPPIALVALEDGAPLGTASLKIRELEIRPEYEYWLGAVYVHPPYRRRGVGGHLVVAVQALAQDLGIERLYLYTRQQETERWYASYGWQVVERPLYRGRPAVIMTRLLQGLT